MVWLEAYPIKKSDIRSLNRSPVDETV